MVFDAGGLPEVVIEGKNGFIVSQNNPEEAANRIMQLLNDPQLRNMIGQAGRQFVLANYEWKENAGRMERLYGTVVEEYNKLS